MEVDPTGVGGGMRRRGWSTFAVGASDHDTASLRILADILGYRLKYLRGPCVFSEAESARTHTRDSIRVGGRANLVERVSERERANARARDIGCQRERERARDRVADVGRGEIAKGTQMERVG